MKKLITLITFFVSVSAFANGKTFVLDEGDVSLTPMDGQVTVVNKMPNCPINALCAPIVEVQIDFGLFGCMDRALVNHKVVYNSAKEKYQVFVSAYNVLNKDSLVTFCIAMPRHIETIFVGPGYMGEESVEVHFMGVETHQLEN